MHSIADLSEATRKGMLEKAEQGVRPSFAPLGYRNILRHDGKRSIEPDPNTAPIIVRTFEQYAKGNYSGRSLAAIARSEGLIFRRSRASVPQASLQSPLDPYRMDAIHVDRSTVVSMQHSSTGRPQTGHQSRTGS